MYVYDDQGDPTTLCRRNVANGVSQSTTSKISQSTTSSKSSQLTTSNIGQSEDGLAYREDDQPGNRGVVMRTASAMLRGEGWGVSQAFAYCYLLWEMYTVTYMMEPTEKIIVSTILVSILGLMVWAAMTYLPGQLIMLFHFLISLGGT